VILAVQVSKFRSNAEDLTIAENRFIAAQIPPRRFGTFLLLLIAPCTIGQDEATPQTAGVRARYSKDGGMKWKADTQPGWANR
jgi:hypothetical protein